ncbi:MAG: hypothetical protein SWK76_13830 [Actinomycetota bacterium]|nr:hypothetical protein [Actinomycetota bacterium]
MVLPRDMLLKERFEDYRGRIRFSDLDLASRAVAMLWLGVFQEKVFRSCFPHVASKSLLREVGEIIDSVFLEGYILARAADETGTGSILFTDPELPGSVEDGVEKLRLMYENEVIGDLPFSGEPLGMESLAESLIREIAYGPRITWLEERELLKVHLRYALWAGYKLARFERRVKGERS